MNCFRIAVLTLLFLTLGLLGQLRVDGNKELRKCAGHPEDRRMVVPAYLN